MTTPNNSDQIAALFAHAPELINTPGLAADALGAGGDVGATGQVLSHAAVLNHVAEHVKKQSGIGGFFHDFTPQFVKDAGGGIGEGASWVGKQLSRPLGEVQHEYRYVHDVFERHGVGAGLLSLLPAVVGGVAGSLADVVAGPYGTVLGAEAGMFLGNKLGMGYEDSYNRTKDGADYRASDGRVVSPGRDFADMIDYMTGGNVSHTPFSVISGAADAAFDLTLDPLMIGGKAHQAAKLEGIGIRGAKATTGIGVKPADLLKTASKDAEGNLVLARPGVHEAASMPADRVLDIYQANPRVRQMVDILSKPETNTEYILNNFPKLKGLAKELGEASSHDDVLNVYRDAVTAKNYSVLSGGLPLTGITRRPIQLRTQAKNAILGAGAKDALDAAGNPIVSQVTGDTVQKSNRAIRALSSYRAFNISDDLQKLSSKEFNLGDEGASSTLNALLRQSQNARTANAITARFMATSDLSERTNIYVNSVTDMFRAYGIKDDADVIVRWKSDLQKMTDSVEHGSYGSDIDGKQVFLHDAADGSVKNVGLFLNQQGKIALPSFSDMRKAARESGDGGLLSPLMDKAGALDDWTYQHYTTKFFKPLALLSLGFAFRVSAGELIPATLKYGAGDMGKGFLAAATNRLNPGLGLLVTDQNAEKLHDLRVGLDSPEGASWLRKRAKGSNYTPGEGTKAATGLIRSVDVANKTAAVEFEGRLMDGVPLDALTAYHHDIDDLGIRTIARKAGIQFDRDEVGHIKAAVGKALYGVSKATLDPVYRDVAHLNIMNLNGHMVAPALAAGGSESRVFQGARTVNDALGMLGRKLRESNKRFGNDFANFGGEDDLHEFYWQAAAKEAGRDQGVRRGATQYLEWLKTHPGDLDGAKAAFMKVDSEYMAKQPAYAKNMVGAMLDPEQYSEMRANAFQGLVHSNRESERVFHDFVADAIARGDSPSLQELGRVDQLDRPRVKGRTEEDIPHESSLQNVINTGYRRVLDPIINGLSREPIYTTAVTAHYKDMLPMVEAGYMDIGQAAWVAQQRAVHDMLPLIHNTELRSQFSELMRNFAPFYFAQEQAYRRYGNQILSDPVKFERYRLGVHAITSSGVIQGDGAGNQSIVFPGIGGLTDGIVQAAGVFGIGSSAGIPSQVSGQISSLKSVIPTGLFGQPEGPGASPLVAIGLKEIEKFFPATEPALSKIVGPISQNQSTTDSLIPNAFLKHIIQATPWGERTRSFSTAFAFSLQNAKRRSDELRAQGKDAEADAILPGPDANPADRQKAIDAIKTSTRVLFGVRALLGVTSPLAPKFDIGDYQLRDDLKAEIKKAGDVGTGVLSFLAKNPNATADTVFLSNSKFTGTSVPAGQAALEWVQGNHSFVKDHPLAAAYLIPQTTDFSSEAYNQELAAGLRVRRSPDEFVSALYAAAGNADFYPSLEIKNKAVAADPSRSAEINANFRVYTQRMAAQNPIWYQELNDKSKDTTAHYALDDLRSTLDGKGPGSPQAAGIRDLIADYDRFAQAEVTLKSTRQSTTAVTKRWQDYLTSLSTEQPQLAPVINGVFRRLPTYNIYGQEGQ